MSSFWIDKPVKIRDSIVSNFSENKILLNKEALLQKIDKELEKSTIKLDYSINISENLDKNDKLQILEFINKNYSKKNNLFNLSYSYDLFDYFFTESIVITFYPVGKENSYQNIIGIIIGKKKKLYLKEEDSYKEYNCIEVNFLCLIEKLRNLHVSSIMINILTKKCIELFNINIAYYTIGHDIKSPSFSTKYMYHIPINTELLYDLEFIPKEDKDQFNQVNLGKDNEYELIYINGGKTSKNQYEIQDICINIYDSVLNYSKHNYDIFDHISLDNIRHIMKNMSFHNFLFVSNTKTTQISVKNYFCFFNLDSLEKNTNKTLTNGYLFIMFLDNSTRNSHSRCLQMIIDYCYKNQIFDMITLTNILTHFDGIKYIEGAGLLKYYMFNMEINKYDESRNGLVTI
jgi:hypothetical protein